MRKNGFTLLELLVVVGLIAIIMAFAFTNYTKAQQKTRDIARKNDLKQVQKSLELYKNDQNPQTYPANWSSLVSSYIKAIPVDPREKGSDGSWADYTYVQGSAFTYTMTACLENTSDPDGGAACAAGRGKLYTLIEP
ncbi:prepilin-type N-terminal cleavage/methylation domain-containing protein [Candidatus Collierbacteria bacterium]|nr:prepilin-type N-terminal cleavage/methylation domain-containing protein [Candidatus Collierbacteria bacterium]